MYWKERAIAVASQAHATADEMEKEVLSALKLAESNIAKDIQSWYAKFANNNEISMSEARKLLTEAELEEFKWSVDDYIRFARAYSGMGDPEWERKLVNASARVHVQRLEALQLQIRAEIEKAFSRQQSIMSNGIPLIYEESLNKTLEALGETAAMSQINTKALEKIAERPWSTDGKTFSGRIWGNRDKLVSSIQTDLIQAVTRGDTHAEMTNKLADRMKTSRYNAGRLVRTETTYINAVATKDAYRENGVDKVEIIGTLDSRVCDLCSSMDGMIIDMKTYEPGVTVPPFHPMCRCTTAPAVEDIPDDIFEQLDDIMKDKALRINELNNTIDREKLALKYNGRRTSKESKENPKILYKDVTRIAEVGKEPVNAIVEELDSWTHEGAEYVVDGHNVVLDHKPLEKEVAKVLSLYYRKRVELVPRINIPQGISTPDYQIAGVKYDLKTINPGAGDNTIYNRVKKSNKQANNFVIDITVSGLSEDQISKQIEKIYWSNSTAFVSRIIIIKDNKVNKEFVRA